MQRDQFQLLQPLIKIKIRLQANKETSTIWATKIIDAIVESGFGSVASITRSQNRSEAYLCFNCYKLSGFFAQLIHNSAVTIRDCMPQAINYLIGIKQLQCCVLIKRFFEFTSDTITSS